MDVTSIIVIVVILFAGGYLGHKFIFKRRNQINPDNEDLYQDSYRSNKHNLNPVTIDTQEFDNQYFDSADLGISSDSDFNTVKQFSEMEQNISKLIDNAISLDNSGEKDNAISYLEDAYNIMIKNLLPTIKINKLNETISYYRDNSMSLNDVIAYIDDKYEKASIQDIFGETEHHTKSHEEEQKNEEPNWLEQEAKNVMSSMENSDEDMDVEDLLNQVITPTPPIAQHPSIEELMESISKESKNDDDKNQGIDYEKELLDNLNTTKELNSKENKYQSSDEQALNKVKNVIIDLDKEVKGK